jgi:hypothetical protein
MLTFITCFYLLELAAPAEGGFAAFEAAAACAPCLRPDCCLFVEFAFAAAELCVVFLDKLWLFCPDELLFDRE